MMNTNELYDAERMTPLTADHRTRNFIIRKAFIRKIYRREFWFWVRVFEVDKTYSDMRYCDKKVLGITRGVIIGV